MHILLPEIDNCSSCQKLTTALLETAEGREWPLKIFHDQSPWKNVAGPGGDWTCDLLITSQTRIQLSHRGWPDSLCWEHTSYTSITPAHPLPPPPPPQPPPYKVRGWYTVLSLSMISSFWLRFHSISWQWVDEIRPNFAYALTLTRSRLGLLCVNFRKYTT